MTNHRGANSEHSQKYGQFDRLISQNARARGWMGGKPKGLNKEAKSKARAAKALFDSVQAAQYEPEMPDFRLQCAKRPVERGIDLPH